MKRYTCGIVDFICGNVDRPITCRNVYMQEISGLLLPVGPTFTFRLPSLLLSFKSHNPSATWYIIKGLSCYLALDVEQLNHRVKILLRCAFTCVVKHEYYCVYVETIVTIVDFL